MLAPLFREQLVKITMSHGGVTQEGDVPHSKIVRVSTRETRGCKDCGIDQDCDDTISWEPLEFPAYKSMGTGNCYNDATVRGIIKGHRAGVKPRDPVSRAVGTYLQNCSVFKTGTMVVIRTKTTRKLMPNLSQTYISHELCI